MKDICTVLSMKPLFSQVCNQIDYISQKNDLAAWKQTFISNLLFYGRKTALQIPIDQSILNI